MNINKISSNDWLIKNISEEQFQIEKTLSSIADKIHLKRLELNMDQKQFAKYMHVSQGMVSRWESGSYNFSISTLVSICEKLELSFKPMIDDFEAKEENIEFIQPNLKTSDNWKTWKPTKDSIIIGGAA